MLAPHPHGPHKHHIEVTYEASVQVANPQKHIHKLDIRGQRRLGKGYFSEGRKRNDRAKIVAEREKQIFVGSHIRQYQPFLFIFVEDLLFGEKLFLTIKCVNHEEKVYDD